MPTDLPPRVLCVYDDEDSCAMLSVLLKQLSIEAKSVGNGADALVLARREHFDLYLIDTWIPGTNGVELCRMLRALDPLKPIVFYTGDTQRRVQELAREAGASAYVFKPRFDELFATIAQFVFVETATERLNDTESTALTNISGPTIATTVLAPGGRNLPRERGGVRTFSPSP